MTLHLILECPFPPRLQGQVVSLFSFWRRCPKYSYPDKRPQTMLRGESGTRTQQQETTHMRAHIWEHRWKHTYQTTEESTHRSLRSRNAHGHVTRAILCGNFDENCRTVLRPPRSNRGTFTRTARTQSVWPHCLGKNNHFMAQPTRSNNSTRERKRERERESASTRTSRCSSSYFQL